MADDFLARIADACGIERVGEIVRAAARELTHCDGATFVLRDGDLCFHADEDAISPMWKGQRFPMDECISGWSMVHNEPVAVADVDADDRIPPTAHRPAFVRSLVIVPVNRTRPVGAIGAYWDRTGVAGVASIAALEPVAAAAAAAIDRIGIDTAPWAPNFKVAGRTGRSDQLSG